MFNQSIAEIQKINCLKTRRKGFICMSRNFFDYDDGDFAYTISDNMAFDSGGDLLMRMGERMAMDMVTGDLHFISGWSDDEDD